MTRQTIIVVKRRILFFWIEERISYREYLGNVEKDSVVRYDSKKLY